MGQGAQLLANQQHQHAEPCSVLEGIPCAALLFDRHGNLLASNTRADDLNIGVCRGCAGCWVLGAGWALTPAALKCCVICCC